MNTQTQPSANALDAALAAVVGPFVVGPLIEVPVLVALVYAALRPASVTSAPSSSR
ncbi:hypothetical protein [Arthrobacter sp. ISL-72]|uniref:hypothetical protein n=1 Tax=Arthrobacter sp. ISL-72 TaxID=2819114 RepID=UPI001BEAF8F4|nr:hypothetical protein [Arthrobacter sp. ISL-72]MBT2596532.1 hypothetical protein [Arthrobacter sp. ISL-72]